MTILSFLLLLLGSPQAEEPAAPQNLAELVSVLEGDGRRRWSSGEETFTGAVREEYENGMVLTSSLVDGYEHGLHRLSLEDGRVLREVPMRAGREHGRACMWHRDGRPYTLEHYRNGEASGPQLGWSASGKLERDELVLDGEDVGWSLEALEALERWQPAGVKAAPAHVAFWRAVVRARAGDLAGALTDVTTAFEAGYPTPMDAISYGVLRSLTDDPETRPGLVQLWLDHARESSVVMVAPDEPGEPLLLSIRVVDEVTREPLPGAGYSMHHTDLGGAYFPEDTTWNVRIYTATRTDAEGRVRVRTIRPGYYGKKFDPGGTVPLHIHFSAEADGYRPYAGEARFSDDPRRENDAERAELIELVVDADGLQRGELIVPLQRKR